MGGRGGEAGTTNVFSLKDRTRLAFILKYKWHSPQFRTRNNAGKIQRWCNSCFHSCYVAFGKFSHVCISVKVDIVPPIHFSNQKQRKRKDDWSQDWEHIVITFEIVWSNASLESETTLFLQNFIAGTPTTWQLLPARGCQLLLRCHDKIHMICMIK